MEENTRLFILQADIQSQDIRVLHAFGHVWMSSTMIQDEATDKLGF